MTAPRTMVAAAVIGSADPRRLAAFYQQLLGWTITVNEPAKPGDPVEDGWVMLRPPSGETGLSFQYESGYAPPVWPTIPNEQQMMIHLDIAVEDLDESVVFACDLGATLAHHQPQEDVRVMLDPAGHPFCLFRGTV